MSYEPDDLRLSGADCDALLTLCQRIDLAPGPGGSRITDPGATIAVLGETVRQWVPTWTALRLVALYPSSQLVAHTDPPLQTTRFHVPLTTNAGCWSFSGGQWYLLTRGQAYRMNPSIEHGAVNWGPIVRVHLMIDRVV